MYKLHYTNSAALRSYQTDATDEWINRQTHRLTLILCALPYRNIMATHIERRCIELLPSLPLSTSFLFFSTTFQSFGGWVNRHMYVTQYLLHYTTQYLLFIHTFSCYHYCFFHMCVKQYKSIREKKCLLCIFNLRIYLRI